MNGVNNWSIAADENLWLNEKLLKTKLKEKLSLVVLLRVRNEELILGDTLNHLSTFSDIIVVYEDASTDRTREILKSNPKVAMIIENNVWLSSVEDRLRSETRHRGLLLQEVRKRWDFNWCMCCDADERFFGDIRSFVTSNSLSIQPDAIRISLFDAYMTPLDQGAYKIGQSLINFRKFFGPECRNILMLWKNVPEVSFMGLDAREPTVPGNVVTRFYCQHYGKSLSVEHWEETCEYYVNHFPYDPYGKKWEARKGKAVHEISDFGRTLFPWGDTLFKNSVVDF